MDKNRIKMMEEGDYIKRLVKLHLVYWAIIFSLLAVFLLWVAPGCVNPKAFENFSFASTLISIVLAVVSIVYSFTSKSNVSDNIAGIREIEHSIKAKLDRFDSLKAEIVDEVRGITRPIEDEVSNIRQGQMDASNQMREMLDKMSQKSEVTSDNNGRLLSSASFYGNVMMYILCMSFKTGKEIDLESIGLDFNDNYEYFWGFWVALTALNGRPFDYDEEDRKVKVTKYDEKQLGDKDYWLSIIMKYNNKDEVNKYLTAVDGYFQINNSKNEI